MKETIWSDSFPFIYIEGIQMYNSRRSCDFTCIIKKEWNLPADIGDVKQNDKMLFISGSDNDNFFTQQIEIFGVS